MDMERLPLTLLADILMAPEISEEKSLQVRGKAGKPRVSTTGTTSAGTTSTGTTSTTSTSKPTDSQHEQLQERKHQRQQQQQQQDKAVKKTTTTTTTITTTTTSPAVVVKTPCAVRQKCSEQEANRIHCRETRERRREKDNLLREEVEVLKLYRDIVEEGPDLFSCHGVSWDAPFTFVCDGYYKRLQVEPEDVIDLPLAIIVDPRDITTLKAATKEILHKEAVNNGAGGATQSGILVHLRIAWGGLSFHASMSLSVGCHGVIVVTRLYDA